MATSSEIFTGEDSENVFQVQYNRSWKAPLKNLNNYPKTSKNSPSTTYRLHIRGDTITATAEPPPGKRGAGVAGKNPSSVARRNARERRRIRNVNNAFDELRQHVPNGERNRKKISKVDTLQSAIEYIKALEELVRTRRSKAAQERNKQEQSEARDQEQKQDSNKPQEQQKPSSNSNNFDQDAQNEDVIFVGELTDKEASNKDKLIGLTSTLPTTKSSSKKPQRPTELTESMLKAFDVMLQKCANERKTPCSKVGAVTGSEVGEKAGAEHHAQENEQVFREYAADVSPFEMQSQSSDSGFSEMLNDGFDLEQSCQEVQESPRPDHLTLELASQSPCFGDCMPDFQQSSPILEAFTSPGLQEGFSPIGEHLPHGGFLSALGDANDCSSFVPDQQPSNGIRFASKQLQWDEQDKSQEAVRCNSASTASSHSSVSAENVEDKNFVEVNTWNGQLHSLLDNTFNLHDTEVLDELDQINPTFDFLPSSGAYSFGHNQPFDSQLLSPPVHQQTYDYVPSVPALAYSEQLGNMAVAALW